jgi:short-subunit dehydrogenase
MKGGDMHVLITGASSGLGKGMAKHFASLGWRLSLAARRHKMLEDLAAELDTDTFVRVADLANLDQCEPLVDDAIRALGPIDVLVNNAGIQYVEPYAGVSDERAERLFTVDLLAPLRLQRRVLEDMLPRRAGTVVNVSSMAGIIATPGMCHYNGAKAALASCSESLRVELRDSGVHVVTVYPGPVTTPMEEAARNQLQETAAVKYAPTGTPDTLAALVARAIEKRKPRVIYPGIYGVSRYARVTSQWVTDLATPPLRLPEPANG